ncbi:MAG: protein kinase [Fibrobacteria bacterium]|nr:protein kinase [Fibrobacteria bacterium]
MFCNNCGHPNPKTARFCGKCGYNLFTPQSNDGPTGDTEFADFQRALQGKYELKEQIGHGGMGKVYLGIDVRLERQVAIKLLRPEVSMDEEFLKRFHHEVKISAKLEHPNIIPIFSVDQVSSFNFFVMKYVEGVPLSVQIKRGITMEEIQYVTRDAANALAYAHSQGVIHRDIKPDNIIISQDGDTYLMDFGVAKAISGTRLTGAGRSIGTPKYMSPEQIRGKAVDGRNDIYSMGIVIYEMLVGQGPFSGDNTSMMYKHVHEEPDFTILEDKQIPPIWTKVLKKCLAKDATDRYNSADEIITELNEGKEPISKIVRKRFAPHKTTVVPILKDTPRNIVPFIHFSWIMTTSALILGLHDLFILNEYKAFGLTSGPSGIVLGAMFMILTGLIVFIIRSRKIKSSEIVYYWLGFSVPLCVTIVHYFMNQNIQWMGLPSHDLGVFLSTFIVQLSGFILIISRIEKITREEVATFWLGVGICVAIQFTIYEYDMVGLAAFFVSGLFLAIKDWKQKHFYDFFVYATGCLSSIALATYKFLF